ncbi:MerR family transcriptional regulator [Mycolicibacterium mageritense DSM 44476 = CIP 104973]|uniref:MerR family transcriptional regulator n=11 Tax=Mycobacteriaceae TaxID=1762 RepID=A0A0N9YAR2_MYCFO|nr:MULTISPECIES: MerR family transcriptional regulator [Mycobacteriaceae]OFB37677.1 MerR family transcriptional regulator [Mycolicibacterium sp. (ex Dasyatis americana)]OKH75488.1 MerR family transcriptional regulator [Mycobacterium sp. SWH-M3]AKP60078.1 MerR family transcriptional regulator [Mycobacteroides abscessus UC22]ALI24092.1 Mercuric resistance operon regulatory protein [Mycolicibacterium fortuitum]KLI09366.1 MerR family transcriptional regulator [Mycolicibacterium senegalense]
MSDSGLRSGQVAAAAGVNTETLRYYERRGLLRQPQRSLGGHRLYPPETVTMMRVIKAAQRLGFTLDEVADLLAATRLGSRSEAGLHTRAATKLAEVDQKLAELTAVRDTLRAALAAGCDDLLACAESPCCPLPFTAEPDNETKGGTGGCC